MKAVPVAPVYECSCGPKLKPSVWDDEPLACCELSHVQLALTVAPAGAESSPPMSSSSHIQEVSAAGSRPAQAGCDDLPTRSNQNCPSTDSILKPSMATPARPRRSG